MYRPIFLLHVCLHVYVVIQPLAAKPNKSINQTREIEKRAYYQNYCIDSNQILHSDKDHQMPFVGGPHTRITNTRLRTAAILAKSKDCYISAAGDFDQIWQDDAFRTS